MTDKKKCPKCGSELHSGALFCMYCMHSMQPKTDVTPDVPRRRGVLFWIVLLVAVILLIVLLVFGKSMLLLLDHANASKGLLQNHSVMESDESSGAENTVSEPNEDYSEDNWPDESKPDTYGTPQPTEPTAAEATQRTPVPSLDGEDPVEEQPSEPDETEPKETLPEETLPEVIVPVCEHFYLDATCNAPMTCQKCGDTWGEPDTLAHQWTPEMVTVHHDEVGHYEQQEDYFQKTVYLCFFCGYSQEGFDSLDEVREHITVHSDEANYNHISSLPDMLCDTREVWDSKTVQVWVVDQKAYDETVVKGYICSICGEKKEV